MKAISVKIKRLLGILIAGVFLAIFITQYFDLMTVKLKMEDTQEELAWEKKKREEFQLRLQKKTEELELANNQLDTFKKKVVTLEKNSYRLAKTREDLQKKMSALEKEREAMEAKLHSLPELKKAIHRVQIEFIGEQIKKYIARKQAQKEIDDQKLKLGNRGFIVKEGKTTHKPTVKIEVRPGN